jgi:uncharacterized protein YuzE
MRKVFIECNATTCLHYSSENETCEVSEDTFIDVSSKGVYVDYAPITKKERKLIMGNKEG